MLLSRHRRVAALTLVEVLTAVAIAILFLGSVFALNTSAMTVLKTSRESAWASQVLQQRMESLRIANWQLITQSNCAWLLAHAFMVDANGDGTPEADGSELLKQESETLTLEPYGSSVANPTATKLTRTYGSAPTIVSNNGALLSENALKVTWTISYNGSPGNRSLSRKLVAILAKGGVAK
jgi:hypothetical protein